MKTDEEKPKYVHVTFEELVREVPELLEIKQEAVGIWERHDRWERYEKLKGRIRRLIGWGKSVPRGMPDFVYTSSAYDTAWLEIFHDGYEHYQEHYEEYVERDSENSLNDDE